MSEVYKFMAIVEEMAFYLGAIHLQDTFNFIPDWFGPQGLDERFLKLRAYMDVFSRNMIKHHKEDRQKHPVSEVPPKHLAMTSQLRQGCL